MAGFTAAYTNVIKMADGRGERIKATEVVSTHMMDVLIDAKLRRFIGKDYIRILSKYILSSPHHCSSISSNKWTG